MEDHFNKLTPAEAERLAMLAEECGEIIQIVGKILRHGYESHHPDDPSSTNRDLLTDELSDFYAVVQMMDGDFSVIDAQRHEDEFLAKKLRYTHHQLDPKDCHE